MAVSKLERVVVAVDAQYFNEADAQSGWYVERLLWQLSDQLGSKDTMWAYRFFDSSLGSLVSEKRIHDWHLGQMATRSYYYPRLTTFAGLNECIRKLIGKSAELKGSYSRAEHVARALQEVSTDFVWDPLPFLDEDLSGSNPQMQPNLVVLLSHAPRLSSVQFSSYLDVTGPKSQEELASIFASKLRLVYSLYAKRKIHACWIQPAGHYMSEFLHKAMARYHGSWTLTSVDTLLIASSVLPTSLAGQAVILPAVYPREKGHRIVAKLQVNVAQQRHFVCQVDVMTRPSLSSYNKIRITLLAVAPRKCISWPALLGAETYFMYQHRSGAEKKPVDSDLGWKHELLRRLQHLPEDLVSQRPEMQLLLLYLARREEVGLVDFNMVDVKDGSKRTLQGVLDPLSIYCATLRVGTDVSRWIRASDVQTFRRHIPCDARIPETDSWDKAWNGLRLLGHLEEEAYKDEWPKALTAWIKQTDRSVGSMDIHRWIEVETPIAAADTTAQLVHHAAATAPPLETNAQKNETLLSRDEALSYLSSLSDKLARCLESEGLGLHRFVNALVSHTISALKVASPEADMVEQLRKLLLCSPKELFAKHRESKISAQQKLDEYTVQVKLRLEIMGQTVLGRMAQNELVEEVCDLLMVIQFDVESLLDFADRVIRNSYSNVLPEVVKDIYARTELGGYCAANSEPLVFPVNSQRGKSKEKAKENEEKVKMDRERRVSYFAGRSQKLRVTKKCRRANMDEEEHVAETPMPNRALQLKLMKSDEERSALKKARSALFQASS